MEPLDLRPAYSTREVPGRCIKCLAEHELNDCLRELLQAEAGSKEARLRYELLVAFLKSPASRRLRDEAERHLAEGKKVTLKLSLVNGRPSYKLEVS